MYYIKRVELSPHNKIIRTTTVKQGLTLRRANQDIIALTEALPGKRTVYHNQDIVKDLY